MENKSRTRYDASPEKENFHKNKVSFIPNFKQFSQKQILFPKNISDNNENIIQEINDKNASPLSKQILQNKHQKNISLNNRQLTTKSQETKMEIEVTSSNQLIGSVSTQASNNIKSPIEQKNLNICNTNMIFFPQKKMV